MSILKIALLGPPEVSHFDRRLTFPDRKALALLATSPQKVACTSVSGSRACSGRKVIRLMEERRCALPYITYVALLRKALSQHTNPTCSLRMMRSDSI